MPLDARATLWNQFILAAAIARMARPVAEKAGDDLVYFSYTDTHAGAGTLPGPLPQVAEMLEAHGRFANRHWFAAVPGPLAPDAHPGSWVVAGRVLAAVGGPQLAIEMDVNDIDPAAMEAAKAARERGWVRLWSHDWFLFLRSRLGRPELPHFVFVDPPADDPRGSAYGIDAAILMDTVGVPYMLSYPVRGCQAAIDQVGRTGLELVLPDGSGCGAMLGGGAETVLLDVISDLKVLADILGGSFAPRLPSTMDYSI
ncbi:MAG TPA: hypothetical protein VL974_15185 [Magnetospirillum sp.]|jgi:hypothetical protein|nr:hypothetical protein [Magnetospirillum sp.]